MTYNLAPYLGLAQDHQLKYQETYVLSNMADLQLRQQRWAEAEDSLRRTEQLVLDLEIKYLRPEVLWGWALVKMSQRDLDESVALEAKRQAEEAMKDQKTDMDFARAQAELAEAVAQLNMIRKLRETK